MPTVRVATRGSALARWQAERVTTLLADAAGVDVELVIVQTTGDRRLDVPIHAMGGTGVFVREVQHAVLDGRADLAVHSAKDLPASEPPAGLVLAAVPARGDVRDAMVGSTLAALPTGARVATGSVRRRAQLAAARPDLTFAELRGNIATRLERAEEHDAIVVAHVALERLGLTDRVAEVLNTRVMLPMVAQGALAVECRTDDTELQATLATIDDRAAHLAVRAERAFLASLGGGCELPCGALATLHGDTIEIEAMLAAPTGLVVLRERASGRTDDPEAVGHAVAEALLAGGGRALLPDDVA